MTEREGVGTNTLKCDTFTLLTERAARKKRIQARLKSSSVETGSERMKTGRARELGGEGTGEGRSGGGKVSRKERQMDVV